MITNKALFGLALISAVSIDGDENTMTIQLLGHQNNAHQVQALERCEFIMKERFMDWKLGMPLIDVQLMLIYIMVHLKNADVDVLKLMFKGSIESYCALLMGAITPMHVHPVTPECHAIATSLNALYSLFLRNACRAMHMMHAEYGAAYIQREEDMELVEHYRLFHKAILGMGNSELAAWFYEMIRPMLPSQRKIQARRAMSGLEAVPHLPRQGQRARMSWLQANAPLSTIYEIRIHRSV